MAEPIPNPGSDEARRFKCVCAPQTNKRGEGAFVDRTGRTRFIVNAQCPLHGRGSAWASNKETT